MEYAKNGVRHHRLANVAISHFRHPQAMPHPSVVLVVDHCADLATDQRPSINDRCHCDCCNNTGDDCVKNNEIELMIQDCINRESMLSEWELGFIQSLDEQFTKKGNITEKQSERLNKIWDKVTA